LPSDWLEGEKDSSEDAFSWYLAKHAI